jgi:hypothetical protein
MRWDEKDGGNAEEKENADVEIAQPCGTKSDACGPIGALLLHMRNALRSASCLLLSSRYLPQRS